MTLREIQERQDALKKEYDAVLKEILTLTDKQNRTSGEAERLQRMNARADKLEAELKKLADQKRQMILQGAASGAFATEHGDGAADPSVPYFNRNLDPYADGGRETPGEVRGRALKAIERWNAPDELKEGAVKTLERAGTGHADDISASNDIAEIARHILRFSHPHYVEAFRKFVRDPDGGYLADLTPDEHRAWREAREVMRSTLATGGAVLPAPMDPTIVLVSDGSADPMRRVARVDTTTSLTKRYVVSDGSTFSFDAELAEVSDDTPSLSEVEITVQKAQGWIEASIEVWADQPDFPTELVKLIEDGKLQAEAPVFINGTSGSNQPIGLLTRLTATTHSVVSPATPEQFTKADPYKVLQALPPRFRPRASWLAEFSTLAALDQMETQNGSKAFPDVFGASPRLLNRPIFEHSSMPAASLINASTTNSNPILVVGDFSHYVILDRVGMSVNFVGPGHLFGTTSGRPVGKVGWYAYWRVGADVLDSNAFRVLDVETNGA